MGLFDTTAQNPLGFNAGATVSGRCKMTGSAGTKGQLVALTLSASVDLTECALAGTGARNETIVGVLLEDIAQNAVGRVALRGRVQIAGNKTVGVAYTSAASGGIAAAGAGHNVLFIAGETVNGLGWAYFDGVNGLGVGA